MKSKVILLMLILINNVSAQDLSRLGNVVIRLLCLLYGIVPWILTLLFILAGILILVGGPEKRDEGKKVMINAIVGVIILFLVTFLLTLIVEGLEFSDFNECWVWGPAPVYPTTTTTSTTSTSTTSTSTTSTTSTSTTSTSTTSTSTTSTSTTSTSTTTISGPVLECDSCVSCEAMINDPANSGETIKLTAPEISDLLADNTCIAWNNDDVEFDCQGGKITGDVNGRGISINSRDGNAVRNCVFESLGYGIFIFEGSSNTVTDCEFNSNTFSGIHMVLTLSNSITSNSMNSNGGDGVHIDSSSSNIISGNEITSNSNGISLVDFGGGSPDNNRIDDNTVCENTDNDINQEAGSGNTGDNNKCDNVVNWKDASVPAGCAESCCTPESGTEGCWSSFMSITPPYGTCPVGPDLDEIGVYCSGKVKERVDACSALATEIDRVKCLIGWAYSHFDNVVYDHSMDCRCVGRKGLGPNDVIECAEAPITFPPGCGGCGVCVDFATTLYSMLMTCGSDCGITTDNCYMVGGCLAFGARCDGCHSWLLYKHPTHGWVFVDPTITSLPHIDGYFMPINQYPCINFGIDNLASGCLQQTPDSLVRDTLCSGYGIDLRTCNCKDESSKCPPACKWSDDEGAHCYFDDICTIPC